MSTTVLDRPLELRDAGNGGRPARRAVVRWAWRLFRREWRQQLIVLALILLAVAATIIGAAIATNTPPPANTGFGSANHLLTLPGTDLHLSADIEKLERAFGSVEVIENRTIATGLVQGALLRSQDPHGTYSAAMLALRPGHYPSGAGQVAMTSQLAATFNLQVGGVWHEAGRDLRVVGLVENPQNLLDNFALVAPGQLRAPSQVTVLFDASTAQVAAFTFPSDSRPVTPASSNGIAPDLVVFAIAIVGLIFVGLVAVAGFTVLAQRRCRGLGMLSSLGATDRNVRLVMVANGAFVGIVGALVGAVIGLGAWIAYAPHLSTSTHHRISWTSIPWWLVGTVMVLAVLTAAIASRRPARAIARTPVVAALSGRPAPPKSVHRSAVPGVVLLALGPLLLAYSGGWGGGSGGSSTLLLLGGLAASVIGLLLLAPLGVALLGVNVQRAPVAMRIALRDLSRYRARSGAALAATSLAVLIAMLIALLATGRFADPVDYFGPNLAANQLVLYTPGNSANGVGPGRSTPGDPQNHTTANAAHQAKAITASLHTHDVLALDAAGAILLQGKRGGPGTIYVATPTLLARYGINPNSIDATTILITSRPGLQGTAGLQLLHGDLANPTANLQALREPKIQTFTKLPTDTSAPNLLVTAYAVAKLKLQVRPAAWLMQMPKSLTAPQINIARQTAAAAGLTIDVKNDAPSLSRLSRVS